MKKLSKMKFNLFFPINVIYVRKRYELVKRLVQCHNTRLALSSECHEWSAAPISACLRRGPIGYFRNECCTGGK